MFNKIVNVIGCVALSLALVAIVGDIVLDDFGLDREGIVIKLLNK